MLNEDVSRDRADVYLDISELTDSRDGMDLVSMPGIRFSHRIALATVSKSFFEAYPF